MSLNKLSLEFIELLRIIETILDDIHTEGQKAFELGDHIKAKQIADIGVRLVDFKNECLLIIKQLDSFRPHEIKTAKKKKRIVRRIEYRSLTPIESFRIPILESLIELGGSGHIEEVLQKVEVKMKEVLTDLDYEKLSINPDLRWRNTAQWCRFVMVRENLLSSNSPRGVWEITEKGRRYLD